MRLLEQKTFINLKSGNFNVYINPSSGLITLVDNKPLRPPLVILMAVQAWSLTFFLVLYIGNGLAFPQKEKEELISLYDENDSVIELVDANFTTAIHDTNVAWVRIFYYYYYLE